MSISRRETGERLRAARISAPKLTQNELAARLGVRRETVSKWESGSRSIPEPQLRALSLELGVSYVWLCGTVLGPSAAVLRHVRAFHALTPAEQQTARALLADATTRE